MNNYRKIWESINNESKGNPSQTHIARRIRTNGSFEMFLATDFRKAIRLLYVKYEEYHELITENLPRFRGLEISVSVVSLGEFTNTPFIKFMQSIPNTDNIFELVISDICDKIARLENKRELSSVLVRTLSEWKLFFEKQENEILSVAAQKGLIGELYFLRDHLFRKYSFSESLSYWTGSEKTNHDFQIVNNAVEVKTTAGKQHKKFTVSSEKQLDNTGLAHLYLVLFSLNLHSNMPDRTLPSVISKIYSIIQDDPVATFQFQIKLLKYGYNETLAEKYTIGFSVLDMRFLEVKEGFPRLLQMNLPDGVGDLKYSVVVAACTPFEIKTDPINNI